VINVNETLVNSVEQVLDIKDESQFEIYCALGDQLVKEFFIEQTYMEAASSPSSSKKKDNGPFNDDGRIPTLTKIGDWFVRIITRLNAWFTRKMTLKTIEKIRKLPLYKQNEKNPNAKYQCIFPQDEWRKDYDELNAEFDPNKWKSFVFIKDNNTDQLYQSILKAYNAGTLQQHVKNINKLKEDSAEMWKEIKNITAVNTTAADAQSELTQDALDKWLYSLTDSSEKLGTCIRDAYQSKDAIKKLCTEMASKDTVDRKVEFEKMSEQYVKFITDITRCWLYMAQIEKRITDRIYYSLTNAKKEEKDET
jgi:hypothetical protein